MSPSCTASVGLPVYNGAAHLERAVESLLSQTMDDFELIISDNGSQDHSVEIARSYGNDPRVRVISHPINRGVSWNFEYVFRQASGTYFAWAAADDSWHPRFLERCVAALEGSPTRSPVSAPPNRCRARGHLSAGPTKGRWPRRIRSGFAGRGR